MKLVSSATSRLARYISAAISGVPAARATSAGSSGRRSSSSNQRRVGGVGLDALQLGLDQAALALVEMAVGLGRGDHRLQHRAAVLLDLGRGQQVDGARLGQRSLRPAPAAPAAAPASFDRPCRPARRGRPRCRASAPCRRSGGRACCPAAGRARRRRRRRRRTCPSRHRRRRALRRAACLRSSTARTSTTVPACLAHSSIQTFLDGGCGSEPHGPVPGHRVPCARYSRHATAAPHLHARLSATHRLPDRRAHRGAVRAGRGAAHRRHLRLHRAAGARAAGKAARLGLHQRQAGAHPGAAARPGDRLFRHAGRHRPGADQGRRRGLDQQPPLGGRHPGLRAAAGRDGRRRRQGAGLCRRSCARASMRCASAPRGCRAARACTSRNGTSRRSAPSAGSAS